MLCFASHHLRMDEECTERRRLPESYEEHMIPAVMEKRSVSRPRGTDAERICGTLFLHLHSGCQNAEDFVSTLHLLLLSFSELPKSATASDNLYIKVHRYCRRPKCCRQRVWALATLGV